MSWNAFVCEASAGALDGYDHGLCGSHPPMNPGTFLRILRGNPDLAQAYFLCIESVAWTRPIARFDSRLSPQHCNHLQHAYKPLRLDLWPSLLRHFALFTFLAIVEALKIIPDSIATSPR
jgi:hypothetical protein